jgi:hypothetical protein
MGTPFNWQGFDVFIQDATLPNVNKHEIACIYGKHLYNVTATNNFYYRFLNSIIADINNNHPTNTFNAIWQRVDAYIGANPTFIKDVGEKILVLSTRNNHFANNADVVNSLGNNAVTITINTTDLITTSPGVNSYDDASGRIKSYDRIPVALNHYNTLVYQWNEFEALIKKIKDKDTKLYIVKYFTTFDSINSDSYIRIKKFLSENEKITTELTAFDNYFTRNPNILLTYKGKLLYLFQNNDLENNIDKPDAFLCLNSESAPGYVFPTAFNPDDLPAGWDDYRLMNILSYDIVGLGGNAGAVANFISYVMASTPPYEKFKPVFIALQNTTDLITDATNYPVVENDAITSHYTIYKRKDNTMATIIANEYLPNNLKDIFEGDINASVKYHAIVVDKYELAIINIQNDSTTPVKFIEIKSNCIDMLNDKKGIDKYNVIISINGPFTGDTRSHYTKYEKAKNSYAGTNVDNILILTNKFESVEPYDYNLTGTGFTRGGYVAKPPVGKRIIMKIDAKDLATKQRYTPKVTTNLKNIYDVITTQLNSLTKSDIDKLLNRVEPPHLQKKPAKAKTPTKTATGTPATATPPGTPATGKLVAGATILNNIYCINFTQKKDGSALPFTSADFTTKLNENYYNTVGYNNPIKFKVNISGADILIEDINKNKKNDKEYYIRVKDSGTTYYLPIIIDGKEIKIKSKGAEHTTKLIYKRHIEFIKSIDLYKPIGATPSFRWNIFNGKTDAAYVDIKDKKGKDYAIKLILDNKSPATTAAATLQKNKTRGAYCFVFSSGGGNYYIHDIVVDDDNQVMWKDTTPGSTDIYNLTTYVTFH